MEHDMSNYPQLDGWVRMMSEDDAQVVGELLAYR